MRGKAILYADSITRSMRAAMDETDRRRNKQVEYNTAHGITPRSIVRRITDIMEGARSEAASEKSRAGARRDANRKVAEEAADYSALTPDQIASRIKKLEAQMYKHAQDLEFEEAARVRDEIHKLRTFGLIS